MLLKRFLYIFVVIFLITPSSLYSVVQHQIEKRFHVVGVVGGATDNHSVVLLRDEIKNKSFTLKVGQKLPSFKGASIAAISSKKITITHDKKEIILNVGNSGRSTLNEVIGSKVDHSKPSARLKERDTKKLLDSAWEDLYEGVDWQYEDLDTSGKEQVRDVVIELVNDTELNPALSAEIKDKIKETKGMSDEELEEYLEVIDEQTSGW